MDTTEHWCKKRDEICKLCHFISLFSRSSPLRSNSRPKNPICWSGTDNLHPFAAQISQPFLRWSGIRHQTVYHFKSEEAAGGNPAKFGAVAQQHPFLGIIQHDLAQFCLLVIGEGYAMGKGQALAGYKGNIGMESREKVAWNIW